MSEQKIRLRLNRLREKMKEYHCAVCIIPTGDPHQSEYVGEHFALRKYFSGFTGSAGTLAVTEKEALLWTDGRYYVQAERELKGTGIALCRAGAPGEPDIYQWLEEYLKKQDAFGFLDLLEHYSGEEAGLPDPGRDAAGCIAVDDGPAAGGVREKRKYAVPVADGSGRRDGGRTDAAHGTRHDICP